MDVFGTSPKHLSYWGKFTALLRNEYFYPVNIMTKVTKFPYSPYECSIQCSNFNPLSANPTKWSNTLKQVCLSVFDHFVKLALKGLRWAITDNKKAVAGRK